MADQAQKSVFARLHERVIGRPRAPLDRNVFHKLSLVAFLAWVGLGADGLSSANYGPAEAFIALSSHPHLALIIGLASAFTVLVISASYSQIIEVFPSGGGGYLVASKLLSPQAGMVSGCALLIDYVLTISVSVASGADAVFSVAPSSWHENHIPLYFAVFSVIALTILNMRGVKESVVPLVPIFLIFVATHAFAIVYSVAANTERIPSLFTDTATHIHAAVGEGSTWGLITVLLMAYSMGAGTYTGIEAVSNGMSMLREPRVRTAKRTMLYMAVSLATAALGLMIAYVLFKVDVSNLGHSTVNALLFDKVTGSWNPSVGSAFKIVALFSAGAILFVAAQTGFLGGPRVLSYMALDRWMPNRFALLSDRLVTQNGIILMGVAAAATMILTHGSVAILVVLYSINVFITFVLSQLGMVRHWWMHRRVVPVWRRKLAINGFGFVVCLGILVAVSIIKFSEGGWVTLAVTGSLVLISVGVRAHYNGTRRQLARLNDLVVSVRASMEGKVGLPQDQKAAEYDPENRTAVILVNGFNGMGLHTMFAVMRLFGESFRNFAFVEVGVVDAGNFKGVEAMQELQEQAPKDVDQYVAVAKRMGYYAEGFSRVGVDILDEVAELEPVIRARFPRMVFFGGQLVFERETYFTRWLHNYLTFALQRRFFHQGIPFVILPIRV